MRRRGRRERDVLDPDRARRDDVGGPGLGGRAQPGRGLTLRERAALFGLLAALYLSQGLPFGFLTQAVPVLLRQQGASLTTIGDASLLLLPWLLKALWAPWVDRWHLPSVGRRRSWILPLQALTAGLFAGLALVADGDVVRVLMVATAVSALLSATQDIATDALAVERLSGADRGLGNGVQVAAYRLGMILGGGALLVVFARLGLAWSFLGMAAMIAAASVPVWLYREPISAPPEVGGAAAMWGASRRLAGWSLLIVGYKLGEQVGGAVTKPMLVDLGMSLERIGGLAAVDSAASLVGAGVGGWIAGRAGPSRALVPLGLLQALGVAAWAIPAWVRVDPWVDLGVVAGVKVFDGFVGSMATVGLFTAMMDRCDPRQGGTDYTLQASVVLVAGFLGAVLGGRIADGWTAVFPGSEAAYVAHYLSAALVTALGAALMGGFSARASRAMNAS